MFDVPPDALRSAVRARDFLWSTKLRLAAVGYRCVAVDDLVLDARDLLADWQGRLRPRRPEPDWITRACIEWRAEREARERGRSMRRAA